MTAHIHTYVNPVQRDDVLPAGHDMYLRRISTVFTNFVEEVQSGCEARCMEDLHSTTRYVSWSLHTRWGEVGGISGIGGTQIG